MKDRYKISKELQKIPGVGKSIAQDLIDLGFTSIKELQGKNPQNIYQDLCDLTNMYQDRCVLYVFRSAVYFASTGHHKPELLKWWNWQDKNLKNIDAENLALIHVK